jgi:hypothetical protein
VLQFENKEITDLELEDEMTLKWNVLQQITLETEDLQILWFLKKYWFNENRTRERIALRCQWIWKNNPHSHFIWIGIPPGLYINDDTFRKII